MHGCTCNWVFFSHFGASGRKIGAPQKRENQPRRIQPPHSRPSDLWRFAIKNTVCLKMAILGSKRTNGEVGVPTPTAAKMPTKTTQQVSLPQHAEPEEDRAAEWARQELVQPCQKTLPLPLELRKPVGCRGLGKQASKHGWWVQFDDGSSPCSSLCGVHAVVLIAENGRSSAIRACLVAPYRAMLRYYCCDTADTPYRAILFQGS